jgi:hypothetical protein
MALKTSPDESAFLLNIAKGDERAFADVFDHDHKQFGEYDESLYNKDL